MMIEQLLLASLLMRWSDEGDPECVAIGGCHISPDMQNLDFVSRTTQG